MDKQQDKPESKEKSDYAITLLSQSYRRRFMRFLTTEKIKLTTFDAKNELEMINKIQSKNYNIQYLVLDTTFQIQTILAGIKSEHKIPVLLLHDNEYTQEKKDGLLQSYPHIFFHESTSLTLDIVCELLLTMKLSMSKIQTTTKSRERYTFIKELGSGASGIVDLVMDTENDNQLLAVKKINTESLDELSKAKIDREIEMLKLVKAPSIIGFFGDKTVNEIKYIYMEYADGGTFVDRINAAKNKGEAITNDIILDWIIEVSIGMFAMNQMEMIHRDIKSENILLNKGMAKLADLGISRVIKLNDINKTFCGTPFYASPEMVEQKDYSFNTDVWSLGVVLYELISLKKPFDGGDNNQLMKSILTKQTFDFPDNVDLRLKTLVLVMLEKNHLIRPNIDEILRIDFVYDRLLQLNETKEFETPLDLLEKIKKLPKLCHHELIKLHNFNTELETVFYLKTNCTSETYKGGFFSSKVNDCFRGSDLYEALQERKETKDSQKKKDSAEVLDRLLEYKLLTEVSHIGKGFVDDNNYFYKFSLDIMDDAKINNYMLIDCDAPAHYSLLDVSNYALLQATQLCDIMRLNNEDFEDENSIINQPSYLNFLIGISFFNRYKISTLEIQERIGLLLNVYQIMMIHHRLTLYIGQVKQSGMLSFIKNNPDITYSFADFKLNNLEIKHAIFRGNKKPPNNYLRLLSDGDSKLRIIELKTIELRLKCLFVTQEMDDTNDSALAGFKIHNFTRKSVHAQIDEFMRDYCTNFIIFDEDFRRIKIPKCLELYLPDFEQLKNGDFYSFFIDYYMVKISDEEKKDKSKDDLEKIRVAKIKDLLNKIKKNIIKQSFE